MSITEQDIKFIQLAKGKGYSDDNIFSLLGKKKGYTDEQIEGFLSTKTPAQPSVIPTAEFPTKPTDMARVRLPVIPELIKYTHPREERTSGLTSITGARPFTPPITSPKPTQQEALARLLGGEGQQIAPPSTTDVTTAQTPISEGLITEARVKAPRVAEMKAMMPGLTERISEELHIPEDIKSKTTEEVEKSLIKSFRLPSQALVSLAKKGLTRTRKELLQRRMQLKGIKRWEKPVTYMDIEKEIKNYEIAEKTYRELLGGVHDKGFLRDFWKGAESSLMETEKLIPFGGSFVSASENIKLGIIDKKLSKKIPLTSSEKSLMEKYQARQLPISRSRGYNVGQMVTQMPTYIAEFATLSPVYYGVKSAIAGGLTKAGMPRLVGKIAGGIIGGATQGLANIPEISEKTSEYLLPNYELVGGDIGKHLMSNIDKQGKVSFQKAFSKAIGVTTVEYITERSGIVIAKPTKFLQKAILGKWIAKRGLSKADDIIATAKRISGWDGIIPEVFEEEIGEPFQARIEERPYYGLLTPEGKERLLTEVLGIGIFGGIIQIPQVAINQIHRNRVKTPLPKIEIPEDKITKAPVPEAPPITPEPTQVKPDVAVPTTEPSKVVEGKTILKPEDVRVKELPQGIFEMEMASKEVSSYKVFVKEIARETNPVIKSNLLKEAKRLEELPEVKEYIKTIQEKGELPLITKKETEGVKPSVEEAKPEIREIEEARGMSMNEFVGAQKEIKIAKLQEKIDIIDKRNTRDVSPKTGEQNIRQINNLEKKIQNIRTGKKTITGKDGLRYLVEDDRLSQQLKTFWQQAQKPAEKKEVVPEEKEMWKMTYKEFRDYTRRDLGDKYEVAFELGGKQGLGVVGEHHLKLIKQALKEGKPVPSEVLKDYPELAKPKPTPKIVLSRIEPTPRGDNEMSVNLVGETDKNFKIWLPTEKQFRLLSKEKWQVKTEKVEKKVAKEVSEKDITPVKDIPKKDLETFPMGKQVLLNKIREAFLKAPMEIMIGINHEKIDKEMGVKDAWRRGGVYRSDLEKEEKDLERATKEYEILRRAGEKVPKSYIEMLKHNIEIGKKGGVAEKTIKIQVDGGYTIANTKKALWEVYQKIKATPEKTTVSKPPAPYKPRSATTKSREEYIRRAEKEIIQIEKDLNNQNYLYENERRDAINKVFQTTEYRNIDKNLEDVRLDTNELKEHIKKLKSPSHIAKYKAEIKSQESFVKHLEALKKQKIGAYDKIHKPKLERTKDFLRNRITSLKTNIESMKSLLKEPITKPKPTTAPQMIALSKLGYSNADIKKMTPATRETTITEKTKKSVEEKPTTKSKCPKCGGKLRVTRGKALQTTAYCPQCGEAFWYFEKQWWTDKEALSGYKKTIKEKPTAKEIILSKKALGDYIRSQPKNEVVAKTLKVGDRFLHQSGEVYVVVPTPKSAPKGQVYIQDGQKKVLMAKDKVKIVGNINDPKLIGKSGGIKHYAGEEWVEGFPEEKFKLSASDMVKLYKLGYTNTDIKKMSVKERKDVIARDLKKGVISVDELFAGIPLSKTARAYLKESGEEMQNLFVPAGRGREAQLTASMLRKKMGADQQTRDALWEANKVRRHYFDKKGKDFNLKYIDNFEKGLIAPKFFETFTDKNTAKHLSNIAKDHKARLDAIRKLDELTYGDKVSYIENYFPHIWAKPEEVRRFVSSYIKKIGKPSFMKKRYYEFVSDGIKSGLKLKIDNVEELVMMREVSGYQHHTLKETIADLKTHNLLKFQKGIGTPEYGYARIDRDAMRAYFPTEKGVVMAGDWIAPKTVARIINNWLSPSLWSRQDATGKTFRGFMKTKNAFVAIKLGLSGFHAIETGITDIAENLALSFKKTARGDFRGGLKDLATVPISIPKSLVLGGRINRAYYKGAKTDFEKEAIDYMVRGNMRPRMSKMWRVGAVENLTKAIRKKDYLGAGMEIIPATLESISYPLMYIWVPNLKMYNYYKLCKDYVESHPDATTDEVNIELGKIADGIDNRFGQLVYDNLFWNKILKDLGVASQLSMGWNLGSIRDFGGTIIDTAKLLRNLKTIKRGEGITQRMAFVYAYVFTIGTLGALMTWLMTKEKPKELLDYFYPRTGNKNPDGSDERMLIPAMTKDIFKLKEVWRRYGLIKGSVQFATDKLNPILMNLIDLYQNENFYGVQIRDKNAPAVKQAEQLSEYLIQATVPISVSAAIRQKTIGYKKTGFEKIAPYMGFVPAPTYITKSEGQKLIQELISRKFGSRVQTKEQWERSQKRSELRKKIYYGTIRSGELAKAVKQGVIKSKEYHKFVTEAKLDADIRLFKMLTTKEQEYVLSKVTPPEKARYGRYKKTPKSKPPPKFKPDKSIFDKKSGVFR